MTFHRLLIPLLLPLSLALVPGTAQAQSDEGAAAEIRAARLAQNRALAAPLLDSAATFWTEDVVVVASRGAVLRGKNQYRMAFAGDSAIVYVRTPATIHVASAWPLAWEEGQWSGHLGAGGPEVIGGRYAAQWHRIDGRWLIRSEIFVALTCSGDPCTWPIQSP
jgi:ketosteroid isomerase-like protein